MNKFVFGAVALAIAVFAVPFVYKNGILRVFDPRTRGADPASTVIRTRIPSAGMPQIVDIAVPFSVQAPFGDWNQPWQDACEEDAVFMSVAWARGFDASPRLAAEEILKEIDFEKKVLGRWKDTDVADTARLFREFYHYDNIEVREGDATPEAIKRELRSGHIVIVPLAGALLDNPYFTSPPLYHMVVIRGYDDTAKEFITNEPGTKHGDGFRYSYADLTGAIHDWTGVPATILEGKKAMIVVGLPERGGIGN